MTDKDIVGWFRDHRATRMPYLSPSSDPKRSIERLDWRKPGSWDYSVVYLIMGRTLIVTGDVGDAVYGWSSELTFEWLAGLEIGYFASKCVASENGRGGKEWSARAATERVKVELKNASRERRRLFDDRGGLEALHSLGEWAIFLEHNGMEVFGENYYELGGIGEAVSCRTRGHLIGIKMAVEQLAKAAVPA